MAQLCALTDKHILPVSAYPNAIPLVYHWYCYASSIAMASFIVHLFENNWFSFLRTGFLVLQLKRVSQASNLLIAEVIFVCISWKNTNGSLCSYWPWDSGVSVAAGRELLGNAKQAHVEKSGKPRSLKQKPTISLKIILRACGHKSPAS